MYQIRFTARYKREQRKLSQKDQDLLDAVAQKIACGEKLPEKYRDHALSGRWHAHRECHVRPDLLLLYRIEKEELILVLVNVGKHSVAFKK